MENNTAGYWIWFLIIGAVVGWLAGLIVKGRGFGLFGDIVVGVLGGVLGGWIAGMLGFYATSSFAVFLVALGGAVILVGFTRIIVAHR